MRAEDRVSPTHPQGRFLSIGDSIGFKRPNTSVRNQTHVDVWRTPAKIRASQRGGSARLQRTMEAAVEHVAKRTFQIVVAASKNRGIGLAGGIPWRLPGDLKYFKAITTHTHDAEKRNAVIMGRKTWESLPEKFKPLPGRMNVVLTRKIKADENSPPMQEQEGTRNQYPDGVYVMASLDAALKLLAEDAHKDTIENVYVIGGGVVYEEALSSPLCEAIHYTEVGTQTKCDTYFPEITPDAFRVWSASEAKMENGVPYTFLCYTRAGATITPNLPPAMTFGHEEYQYLDMVKDIIETGCLKGDRTGVGTLSKFGRQMRFNLRYTFPLLTTKRTFWRGVAEELLWFISGSTNANLLREKGVHIWDGNGSREFLDNLGLQHREEMDLGPVYGFQWRHFGAKYTDMHADYSNQGVDQLAEVIHKIKHTPNDRRIVLSAWNPCALKEMALPPCHMFCQFYVANGELSCQMYQRSCDLGLGVPFNIASYALLTRMIAHVCDLKPGDFVHVLGDAHVYTNHVEPLLEQLKHQPRAFPILRLNPEKKDIDAFTFDDFELIGYEPHKKIPMQMAV